MESFASGRPVPCPCPCPALSGRPVPCPCLCPCPCPCPAQGKERPSPRGGRLAVESRNPGQGTAVTARRPASTGILGKERPSPPQWNPGQAAGPFLALPCFERPARSLPLPCPALSGRPVPCPCLCPAQGKERPSPRGGRQALESWARNGRHRRSGIQGKRPAVPSLPLPLPCFERPARSLPLPLPCFERPARSLPLPLPCERRPSLPAVALALRRARNGRHRRSGIQGKRPARSLPLPCFERPARSLPLPLPCAGQGTAVTARRPSSSGIQESWARNGRHRRSGIQGKRPARSLPLPFALRRARNGRHRAAAGKHWNPGILGKERPSPPQWNPGQAAGRSLPCPCPCPALSGRPVPCPCPLPCAGQGTAVTAAAGQAAAGPWNPGQGTAVTAAVESRASGRPVPCLALL